MDEAKEVFEVMLSKAFMVDACGYNIMINGHYERRMKIVEMGGAQELVNMLGAAKDDNTRNEALKALTASSPSDRNSNTEETNPIEDVAVEDGSHN
ncbi:hypothetical protein ACFX2C_006495 [Malus domestica]